MKNLILIIFVLLTTYNLQLATVHAQGTCTCSFSTALYKCIPEPSCAPNYIPECASSPGQCNTTPSSCTCIAFDPVNDTTCGDVSQSCCGGHPVTSAGGICDRPDLICYFVGQLNKSLCLTQSMIDALPGNGSAPIDAKAFCDSSGNSTADPGTGLVYTALGCLPFTATTLITSLLSWATGITGTISFLVLVYASFLIITSTGDIKRVQAGRELAFSAAAAIILVTLAILLLNFLGLNILGLGSLGFSV